LHDPDEGDKGEDDVGDAMLDDEDGDEDMLRRRSARLRMAGAPMITGEDATITTREMTTMRTTEGGEGTIMYK
jgi:hypothetical protein